MKNARPPKLMSWITLAPILQPTSQLPLLARIRLPDHLPEVLLLPYMIPRKILKVLKALDLEVVLLLLPILILESVVPLPEILTGLAAAVTVLDSSRLLDIHTPVTWSNSLVITHPATSNVNIDSSVDLPKHTVSFFHFRLFSASVAL